ncbi:TA system VapC family ribonuclease toxin [Georgenia sp. Z1491]|uniref:TA system VapC family ribonuclease toxin n=1 Tax=Georgenia sp. Z1491 TaxID=3416707 RepID=UPI003CF3085A
MTVLLDANVLIALAVAEHEHHDRAERWVDGVESFALCPVVEGALTRFLVRTGEGSRAAAALLEGFGTHPACVFWPDDLSYRDVDMTGTLGHRQVTDTYLVALARHRGGRLATFDAALAARFPDVVTLVP